MAAQADESKFPVPGRPQFQYVVGSIATSFDTGSQSDTTSTIDEKDVDDFEPTVPITALIKKRQDELNVLITKEPETPEAEAPGTPEAKPPVKVKQWKLQTMEDWTHGGKTRVELVIKPTASNMVYTALHPGIYRFMKPLRDLDKVARHLDVTGWWEEADRIWPDVRPYFRALVSLGDDAFETTIQLKLRNLISEISLQLKRVCHDDDRICATVRGTLALDHLEVRGVTDLVYSSNQRFILAAEIKTDKSCPKEQYWYRKSRGVQVLNALYGCHCPTLLVTQNHFKLFLENDKRDCVFTYPYDDAADGATIHDKLKASVLWMPTADSLFYILVICLLKADLQVPAVKSGDKPQVGVGQQPGHAGQSTAETPHKPAGVTHQTQSSPTANLGHDSSARAAEPTIPRFYAGVDDEHGNRIYQLVHVSPPQAAEFSCDDSKDPSTSSEDTVVL